MDKILKATHEGELDLNDVILNVAVLENGQRIITQSAVFKALGREQRGNSRIDQIPAFMDAKNLQGFVDKDVKEVIKKVEYIGLNKKYQQGFDYQILPTVAELYLKARDRDTLTKTQLDTAKKAEILIRSLAKVGLIALIDEATGYQYDREKKELQVIFKELVSNEILEYQQQFHLSFYREIFRLWDIPFTPKNIKRKPMFLGHLTNKYVYKNLPKGIFVLDKLKSNTPKTEKGNFKYRLHQSLTEDKGRETLKKVLYTVEALASISKNKKEFDKLINEKYGQKEIPFLALEALDKQKNIGLDIPLSDFNKSLKKGLEFKPKKEK